MGDLVDNGRLGRVNPSNCIVYGRLLGDSFCFPDEPGDDLSGEPDSGVAGLDFEASLEESTFSESVASLLNCRTGDVSGEDNMTLSGDLVPGEVS